MLLVQVVALRVWQRGTFYCQPKYVDGGIWGLSSTRCLQIRFWYWALPMAMCPWKPSVAGCSASSVFHLLNNFTLDSSIFATFSTRYNLQTNSSASWNVDVVRSPSPMCWSSLCSLTNTPLEWFSWGALQYWCTGYRQLSETPHPRNYNNLVIRCLGNQLFGK